MQQSFSLNSQLANLESSSVMFAQFLFEEARACVQARKYDVAISFLERAMFECIPDNRIRANRLRQRMLLTLWAEIEDNFWTGVSVQVHEHCIEFEKAISRERKKFARSGLADELLKHASNDNHLSHVEAYYLGQAAVFAGTLCQHGRQLDRSEMDTFKKLLCHGFMD